jgi:hypothetical protein
MFERSNAFQSGQRYLQEVMRLIEDPQLVTDEERVALLAQVDNIFCEVERLFRRDGVQDRSLAVLARLVSDRGLEGMVRRGASHHILGALRERRYQTFCRFWRDVRKRFLADSREARHSCVVARQWPMFLREYKRRFEGECLLARLYASAMWYRRGIHVNVGTTVFRLQALGAKLPHRST